MKPNTPLLACCGSLYYVSPEVLNRSGYDHKVDMWSFGVIVFMLITGWPPFEGEARAIKQQIVQGQIGWRLVGEQQVSHNCTDFISMLLQKDPGARPTAANALNHPWLRAEAAERCTAIPGLLRSLELYHASPPLRRASLQLLTQELTSEETRELSAFFWR